MDPCFPDKIVDADIVEPGVVKVLATDDEETVSSDGREVSITGSWSEGVVG